MVIHENEKFQWHHRESHLRPRGLWSRASTNCATARLLLKLYN
jgi:hypothetical protein